MKAVSISKTDEFCGKERDTGKGRAVKRIFTAKRIGR